MVNVLMLIKTALVVTHLQYVRNVHLIIQYLMDNVINVLIIVLIAKRTIVVYIVRAVYQAFIIIPHQNNVFNVVSIVLSVSIMRNYNIYNVFGASMINNILYRQTD